MGTEHRRLAEENENRMHDKGLAHHRVLPIYNVLLPFEIRVLAQTATA